jgi:uncharacterized protein YbjQ (UPF0145 family)
VLERLDGKEGPNEMGMSYSAPGRMVAHNMVTTQFELDGFRVVRTLGVVRGIVVRSRSIFGTIGAGLQTILGGNITLLTNLCEKTRAEAFDLMLQHAANARRHRSAGVRYRRGCRARKMTSRSGSAFSAGAFPTSTADTRTSASCSER